MKRSEAFRILLALICCLSPEVALLRAQSAATDASDPKFAPFVVDVVSIKQESKSSGLKPFSAETPDGYSQQHFSFQGLIYRAYHTDQHTQLNMGAPWISLGFY